MSKATGYVDTLAHNPISKSQRARFSKVPTSKYYRANMIVSGTLPKGAARVAPAGYRQSTARAVKARNQSGESRVKARAAIRNARFAAAAASGPVGGPTREAVRKASIASRRTDEAAAKSSGGGGGKWWIKAADGKMRGSVPRGRK